MCDEIVFLAEQDEFRFITICEDNTIHLAWDRFTIYLSPQELLSLDQTLDRSVAGFGEMVTSNATVFSQDEVGWFLLQIYDMVLRLSSDDFLLIADMVSQATAQLPEDMPRLTNSDISVYEIRHPLSQPSAIQYSLN
ncbi:MAG: hypothetical protein CSA11_11510 [Chloroflexi bacterium]|nr:MAG: hypothetical protein CSA11_11510 [Chloroflexota bacterium]